MQFPFHINYGMEIYKTTCKLPTEHQVSNVEKIYVCERAERVSLENFRIIYVPKTPVSFNVWVSTFTSFVCIIWHVYLLLCYICTFIAVSLLDITQVMTWHYV